MLQKAALISHSIRKWCNNFQETGCLCKGAKSPDQPGVSAQNVERARDLDPYGICVDV